MKLEFSAGGVIYRRKEKTLEFLLILDSYGKWTFPKGHIEKQESPEDAASREVLEETGLNSKLIKLLDKIDYWFKKDKDLIHKFVYFFLMEAPYEAKLNPQLAEIQDAKWLAPDEAKNFLNYRKDDLPLLMKAIEELNFKD